MTDEVMEKRPHKWLDNISVSLVHAAGGGDEGSCLNSVMHAKLELVHNDGTLDGGRARVHIVNIIRFCMQEANQIHVWLSSPMNVSRLGAARKGFKQNPKIQEFILSFRFDDMPVVRATPCFLI